MSNRLYHVFEETTRQFNGIRVLNDEYVESTIQLSNEEIELLKKIRGYGDATFVGVEVNVTSVNLRSDNAEEEYVQAGNQAQLNVKEAGEAIASGVTLVTTNTPKTKDPKKEAARRAAAKKAAPANGEQVKAPFPGLIKNLLVAEGATVKKDQPILVLEAMKMDNDITAPCDNAVADLFKAGVICCYMIIPVI